MLFYMSNAIICFYEIVFQLCENSFGYETICMLAVMLLLSSTIDLAKCGAVQCIVIGGMWQLMILIKY